MWPLDHRQTDNPACMSRVLFQTCEMKVSKDHVSDSWQMTSRLNQQPCLTSVSQHCRPAWPASVGFTFTVLCVLDQCTAFSHTTYMSISPQIWQRKLFIVKCRQLSCPADLCSVFSPYMCVCVWACHWPQVVPCGVGFTKSRQATFWSRLAAAYRHTSYHTSNSQLCSHHNRFLLLKTNTYIIHHSYTTLPTHQCLLQPRLSHAKPRSARSSRAKPGQAEVGQVKLG